MSPCRTSCFGFSGRGEHGDERLLLDMTDYYSPMADQFVPGAVSDATIGGKIYALPDAVRPQMLFYNAKVFGEIMAWTRP